MRGWSAGVVAAYRGSARPAVIDAGAMVTAPELSGAIAGLGGQVLLHEPAFAGLAAELGQLTGVRPVPVTGLPDDRDSDSDVDRLAAPDADSVAAYLHTGGTTGAPKRVALTQRVLVRRSAVLAGLTAMDGQDAVYATGSPIHHIGGLGNTLAALSAGAAVVATASFSVDWWRGLKAHRVTHALLVPSMIEMLLAAAALDEVPLRTLIYGASPIRPETLSRVLDPAARGRDGEPVRADRRQPDHLPDARRPRPRPGGQARAPPVGGPPGARPRRAHRRTGRDRRRRGARPRRPPEPARPGRLAPHR